MKKLHVAALGLAAASGLLASCTSDKDKAAKNPEPAPAAAASKAPASEAPLTIEKAAQVVVTAKVKAVNYATREVTLQDSSGHAVSFIAGPQVQRLNEVLVGDTVTAEYTALLMAELRPPTAEEAANPIAVVVVTGSAPKGADPARSAAGGVRVVTTVQAVDLAKMLVTLKGPLGDTTTVRARSTENIKKLHVGDTIVVTYAEGLAISLVKK